MEIHFVSWRTVSLEISKPYRPIPCRTIVHFGLPDTPKTRNILKSEGKLRDRKYVSIVEYVTAHSKNTHFINVERK